MDSLLRTVALGTVAFDRGKTLWRVGLLAAAVITALTGLFMALGLTAEAVPLAVGALFAPLAAATERGSLRLRSQAWGLLWVMLTALIGSLVSRPGVIALATGVLLAPVVAFLTGLISGVGPTARLVSTLSLVTYAVFMGIPDTPVDAVRTVLLVGLGGVVQIAVFVVADLLTSRGQPWHTSTPVPSVLARIRPRLNTRDDFLRHGVRLALAFTAATVISQLLAWPHQYWIPMTVAWVTVPDATGTVTKVVARIAGTMVGLALIAPAVGLLEPVPAGVALLVGVGALVSIVYLYANYAVCVVGVTFFMVALFTLIGDPVVTTIAYRAIDTVLAATLAVVFALVWPSVVHEPRHPFRSREAV